MFLVFGLGFPLLLLALLRRYRSRLLKTRALLLNKYLHKSDKVDFSTMQPQFGISRDNFRRKAKLVKYDAEDDTRLMADLAKDFMAATEKWDWLLFLHSE